jgi:soluble lytic murein transglycosylase-like protein
VSGVTSSGTSKVLIVTSQESTATVAVPDSVDGDIEPSSVMRMLVRVPSDADGDVRTNLVLIASAQDGAVTIADRQQADRQQAAMRQAAQQRAVSRASYAYPTSRAAVLTTRDLGDAHPIAPLPARVMQIYMPYRRLIARWNPRLTAHQVDTITTSILFYSDNYRIDPRLIVAMIIAESDFDPHSTSRTGAAGLGQLMPETAAGLGVRDPYDPVQNIGASVYILSHHVQNYGGASSFGIVPINTLALTMAAYNAGPGAVKKYGGVPPYRETQRYVQKVAAIYHKLCGSG